MNIKDDLWYKVMIYGLEFIGRYYGTYRAFVVDNNDTGGLGRLQLRVPHLDPYRDDPSWAYPVGQWGGDNYGSYNIPQKGDMVFVTYSNGDPEFPLWQHAGYGLNQKPEEFATVRHHGFKTPQGTLVVINDNQGEEEILVRLNSELDWIKITKDELETEAKLIKLGKNGKEWAAMGETLLDKMQQVSNKLDETYQTLITHTHPTNVGPSGPPIQATALSNQKAEMIQIKETFSEWLSKKVKIDKD